MKSPAACALRGERGHITELFRAAHHIVQKRERQIGQRELLTVRVTVNGAVDKPLIISAKYGIIKVQKVR